MCMRPMAARWFFFLLWGRWLNYFTVNPGPHPVPPDSSLPCCSSQKPREPLPFLLLPQPISPPKYLRYVSLSPSPLPPPLFESQVAARRATEKFPHWSPPLPGALCSSGMPTCPWQPPGINVWPSPGPQGPTRTAPCPPFSLPLRSMPNHTDLLSVPDSVSQSSSVCNALLSPDPPPLSLYPSDLTHRASIILPENPFLSRNALSLHIPLKRCPDPSEHISVCNFTCILFLLLTWHPSSPLDHEFHRLNVFS